MGNPKQKWTAEEEEALRAGIAKYGPGKWKFIQRDPEFNKHLHSRSNIDLKDKWRNMSAAAGQGSREKSRAPKPKVQDSTSAPSLNCQSSAPVHPVAQDLPADIVKEDPSKDAKNGPRYNTMVLEALAATKMPSGMDIISLMKYIEQRVEEVPQNFRKLLGSRLRRLVAQEKIEKIDNCYRIKDASLSEQKPASVKDTQAAQPRQCPQTVANVPIPRDVTTNANNDVSLETAATFAALSLAKAEDLSFQAAEAAKEAERIATMAEEAENIVQFANEIYERCSRGETVLIA